MIGNLAALCVLFLSAVPALAQSEWVDSAPKLQFSMDQIALPAAPKSRVENAAPAGNEAIDGYISLWFQKCAGEVCDTAQPLLVNNPLSFSLIPPAQPGTFSADKKPASFVLDSSTTLKAVVDMYALCPHGAQIAEGACLSLYYRPQITLSGDTEAHCTASLNPADAIPFPVMTCAGRSKKYPEYRIGVSLHRAQLK